jgi:3-hydroxyisobutyrate dehydrogenase
MKVGFIGLGNVGGKLAGSLLRNGVALSVHDLNPDLVADFVARGARDGGSPDALMRDCDVVITCLPSPAACDAVLQQMLPEVDARKDLARDVDHRRGRGQTPRRTGRGARRGGGRLSGLGRLPPRGYRQYRHLRRLRPRHVRAYPAADHHGPPYPAHRRDRQRLGAQGHHELPRHRQPDQLFRGAGHREGAGMDLNTAYEAIKISSGTSFVHETESQVILNGSRDISFTMDLVRKDIGLFQEVADRAGVPLEMNPLMISIFEDAIARFGERELSPNIIRRLEEATGLDIRAPGFPPQLTDDEPEEPGYEVVPQGRAS